MSNGTQFQKLILRGWRQFDDVSIEFHPKLTIITGANGSGKTTLLYVLAQHFGWDRAFTSAPSRIALGKYKYLNSTYKTYRTDNVYPPDQEPIGRLHYSDGGQAEIVVPNSGSVQYSLAISNKAPVQGIHISSHRPMPQYRRVTSVPAEPMLPELAFEQWLHESRTQWLGAYSKSSPLLRMKEALISMAAFGQGNDRIQGNEIVQAALRGFVDVLRRILPATLGFKDLSIRMPDVIFMTETGDWPIDDASGGIMTLLDVAWQIFLFSHGRGKFVVTIDEPENHLHPSMQRSLMGNLIRAFPEVQFIVATHSPFVISSVRDSSVYVLRYGSASTQTEVIARRPNDVSSVRLDTVDKAGSANEILRDVLGVRVTLPLWAEAELSDIVDRYRSAISSPETILQLRSELAQLGLEDLYPEALVSIVTHR